MQKNFSCTSLLESKTNEEKPCYDSRKVQGNVIKVIEEQQNTKVRF